MRIPEDAGKILACLREGGYEAYLVGGCVRDLCRGSVPHDWDMTTSATPGQMAGCFAAAGFRVVETGLKHGTLSVICGGEAYEVTTYRVDGGYSDHRHPDEVRFSTKLREDLARRDFTVNAMALGPDDEVEDPFGGRVDLKNGVIRCVGDPEKRFDEDGLRILRALRFAATLDFEIEPATSEAARRGKDLLRFVSAERIRVELFKLLCGIGAPRILAAYPDILGVFLPEILPTVGFDQKNPYHAYDVWTHSVRAIAMAPVDLCPRLALLFHDLGKPSCFTEDERGGHFYGHHHQSAAIALEALDRLKTDHATRDRVVTLVELHDTVFTGDKKQMRHLLNKTDAETVRQLLTVHRADISAQAPRLLEERIAEADRLDALLEELLAEETCFSLKDLALNGNDLIRAGFHAGKELGDVLAALLDDVLNERVPNEKEILLQKALNMQKR